MSQSLKNLIKKLLKDYLATTSTFIRTGAETAEFYYGQLNPKL